MALELLDIAPAVFVGGSTLNIQQLENVDVDPQIMEMLISGGGSVDPLLFATANTDPRVKLQSRDVQTILTTVSALLGFKITAASKFQYKKQATGVDYSSGSVHGSFTTPFGMLYIEDFGAKQGDKEGADINLNYVPMYNGTTAPLIYNVSQALSSSVAINASHALGPVMLEGSALGGVQSIRVKPGWEIETIFADGGLWPVECRIKTRRPSIEIEAFNLSIMNTLGVNGVYNISTGCIAYLLKVLTGGGRDDVGNSTHIATTAATGIYKVTGVTGNKNSPGIGKITVYPKQLSVAPATTVS